MRVSHACVTQIRIPSLFQLKLGEVGYIQHHDIGLGAPGPCSHLFSPVLTCSPIHRAHQHLAFDDHHETCLLTPSEHPVRGHTTIADPPGAAIESQGLSWNH